MWGHRVCVHLLWVQLAGLQMDVGAKGTGDPACVSNSLRVSLLHHKAHGFV